VTFAKVNTDEEQELAGAFNIRSIPTLMIFRTRCCCSPSRAPCRRTARGDREEGQELDMEQVRAEIAKQQAGAQSGQAGEQAPQQNLTGYGISARSSGARRTRSRPRWGTRPTSSRDRLAVDEHDEGSGRAHFQLRLQAELLTQHSRRTGGSGFVPSGVAVLDLDHPSRITPGRAQE